MGMGRFLTAFFVLSLVIAGFFFSQKESFSLSSPIPKSGNKPEKTFEKNTWFPKDNVKGEKTQNMLTLNSNSAILVDYDTGEVIFDKESSHRQAVASTQKIVTALVALENAKLSDTFGVSEKAAKIGEDSMGLTEGEKLPLSDLLYGLMLPSGNDAAVAIAEGVSGDEDKFVDLMNKKVRDLGLTNSKFINASGLDEDGRVQYSSAYDLAVIAHYTWEQYPEFREIVSTYHKELPESATHKYFDLYNETNLLTTYPGVKGIKPGFTWESGLCLVTYAQNNGKKLIGVILGSEDRRGEMKELLDYGFGLYGIKVSHPAL